MKYHVINIRKLVDEHNFSKLKKNIFIIVVGRGNAAGIAIGHGMDDQGVGVRVPVGSRIFHFSTSSRPAFGFPIQWVPGAISPRVKGPGR
jgi:hypothetical protein